MQTLFKSLTEKSANKEKNRLCILEGGDHRYSRPKSLVAIAHFLNDKTDELDYELCRLSRSDTQVTANIYSD